MHLLAARPHLVSLHIHVCFYVCVCREGRTVQDIRQDTGATGTPCGRQPSAKLTKPTTWPKEPKKCCSSAAQTAITLLPSAVLLHSISLYFFYFLHLIYLSPHAFSFLSQLPAMKYAYCCYCSYSGCTWELQVVFGCIALRWQPHSIHSTDLNAFVSKLGSF